MQPLRLTLAGGRVATEWGWCGEVVAAPFRIFSERASGGMARRLNAPFFSCLQGGSGW